MEFHGHGDVEILETLQRIQVSEGHHPEGSFVSCFFGWQTGNLEIFETDLFATRLNFWVGFWLLIPNQTIQETEKNSPNALVEGLSGQISLQILLGK